MSTFSHKLYHPQNGSTEDVNKGLSFTGFFFWPFWLPIKGLWMWLALGIALSFMTMGFGGFIFSLIILFQGNKLREKRLLSMGYLTEEQYKQRSSVPQHQQPAQVYQAPASSAAPVPPQEPQAAAVVAPSESIVQKPLSQDTYFVEWMKSGIADMSGNYDFRNPNTKQIYFSVRDAKANSKGVMGQMLGTNASASYDALFQLPSGEPLFRLVGQGGAFTNKSDLFVGGASIGQIEKSGMMNCSFKITTNNGAYSAQSEGFGRMVSRFKLLKGDSHVGTVHRGEDKDLGANNFLIEFAPGCLNESDKIALLGCFYAIRQFYSQDV